MAAVMWRTVRQCFEGYQKETCSQIHAIYEDNITMCGVVVDPDEMKARAEDCLWFITHVDVYDLKTQDVTCRRCKHALEEGL